MGIGVDMVVLTTKIKMEPCDFIPGATFSIGNDTDVYLVITDKCNMLKKEYYNRVIAVNLNKNDLDKFDVGDGFYIRVPAKVVSHGVSVGTSQ